MIHCDHCRIYKLSCALVLGSATDIVMLCHIVIYEKRTDSLPSLKRMAYPLHNNDSHWLLTLKKIKKSIGFPFRQMTSGTVGLGKRKIPYFYFSHCMTSLSKVSNIKVTYNIKTYSALRLIFSWMCLILWLDIVTRNDLI